MLGATAAFDKNRTLVWTRQDNHLQLRNALKAYMANVSVAVNGVPLASISLAGLEMLDVSVYGALDSDPKARLTAHGGNYSPGGCGHLIWIADHALSPADVLTVKLNDNAVIGDRGKTIAELYPDEEPVTQTDFSITDAFAAELRARPRLHASFIVQAETSTGQQAKATSDALNTDVKFMFLWHSVWPSQARVRMGTYCLADLLAKQAGTAHLEAILPFGESASFALVE